MKPAETLTMNNKIKTLLLHSCCAPCSSYVLEYLENDFCVTVFFYNPNITSRPEYELRRDEQKRLPALLFTEPRGTVTVDSNWFAPFFIEGDYKPESFYDITKGLEACPEGGERCFCCFELRLKETARVAYERGFDYFATTLTVSPHKNAEKINEIGKQVAVEYNGLLYLPSDFKKKGGYQRSIELSKKYGLYRQNYCGCEFSRYRKEGKNILKSP
ncbi:MAG: epoxyqueuosine reductase QueH [Lachnospiraceae bacterium]|nr:epoxyqueuosine reductase QueH [Lachnospiraceae bacterium]